MDNKVTLLFDKSLTNLAGYDYGKQVYYEQIDGKLDISIEFTIVFPPNIKGVASSFVQGLFKNIVDKIGLNATERRLVVVSENNLDRSIKRKLI